jgi:hypothetical protein
MTIPIPPEDYRERVFKMLNDRFGVGPVELCQELLAERDKLNKQLAHFRSLAAERYQANEELHAALGEPHQPTSTERLVVEWDALLAELGRVRALAVEACGIAERLDSYIPHFPEVGGPTMTQKRIAAIRAEVNRGR